MCKRIVTRWWIPLYGLAYSYLQWRSFRDTIHARDAEDGFILSVCVHIAAPFAILAMKYVDL